MKEEVLVNDLTEHNYYATAPIDQIKTMNNIQQIQQTNTRVL